MQRNRPRKQSGNRKYKKCTSITNSRLVFVKMSKDKELEDRIKHDHIWREISDQFNQLSSAN